MLFKRFPLSNCDYHIEIHNLGLANHIVFQIGGKMAKPVPLNDYFLWRRNVETKFPWNRQYLNWEFLNYEEKRIQSLQKWYKKFQKVDQSAQLENVDLYAIPVEINSYWKSAIAELGFYKYIGLAAFYNSSQILVIALLLDSTKRPKNYSLIEIQNPKKTILFNKYYNTSISVIIIEDWSLLESDSIYVDIPYEKGIVDKILNETFILDEQVALCLQSPIMSAPHVKGSIGGISLSSLAGKTSFSKELINTLQLFVPPEYRNFNPPASVYKGTKFEYKNGIKFHLAERPQQNHNVFSPFYSKDDTRIETELARRRIFDGEYSIFSSIVPEYTSKINILKSLLFKYTENEITIPENLDIYKDADIDLLILKNKINEDVWIQTVHARHILPGLDDASDTELNKTIELLNQDMDVRLTEFFKKDTIRGHITDLMMGNIKSNITRVAQSFARRDDNNQLTKEHFNAARGLFLDNVIKLLDNPEIDKISIYYQQDKSDKRFSVVQSYLIANPQSNILEIFENVKGTSFFRDIQDLQGLLDWSHSKGHVIKDINNNYTWVERINNW